MANTTVRIRHSGTSGNVPSSLAFGELAINYADGILFYKASNGSILQFSTSGGGGGGSTFSFATINANSTLVLATSPTDVLSILAGNNVSITANATSKTLTIDSNSAIAVSAQANTIITQGVDASQNVRIQAAFDTANALTSNVFSSTVDSFVGTGSTAVFNLSVTPASVNYTTVMVGGVGQPRSTYSLIGNSLILSSTPASGTIVECTTLGSTNTALYTISYTTNNILSPFLLMGAH